MALGSPHVDRERALFYFENLIHLLSYRSLDEVLAESLSFLAETFQITGGSILYMSIPTRRFQQGRLEGVALEQINRWESSVLSKLRERGRQVRLPSLSPVTTYRLPDQEDVLLNIPLISRDRICGSVSLIVPATLSLSPNEEQALSKFISGVGAIAINAERMAVTRRRLSQLGLFYQMGQAMSSTFDVDRLFQDTIELAVAVLDAQAAVLMLLDEERQELVHKISLGGSIFPEARRVAIGRGIAGWVAKYREPVLLNDAAEDPRFDPLVDGCQERMTTSLLCVPLQIKGKVIGILHVLNKVPLSGFDGEDMSVLITLAAQAAIALENARLYNSVRAERDRIIEAQESVRRQLARNLHDGPVQLLAALAMRLELVERVLDVQPDAVRAELRDLRAMTRQAMQDARMLLFELRPVILETQGLVLALKSYVERLSDAGRFTPHFDQGNFDRQLDGRVAGTVFAIVQEAVTNIEKHARARNVWIHLREEANELIVCVEDDGKGFDVEDVQADYDQGDSFGLLNMKECAELIDGVLTLESSPGRGKPGTLIELRMALPKIEEPDDGGASQESVF